jgi:hypothetical protein
LKVNFLNPYAPENRARPLLQPRREAKAKTGFWFFAVFAVSPWLKIVLSLIPPGKSIYGGMALKGGLKRLFVSSGRFSA